MVRANFEKKNYMKEGGEVFYKNIMFDFGGLKFKKMRKDIDIVDMYSKIFYLSLSQIKR